MSFLSYFIWSADPNMLPWWDIPRWYGFLFALGFILSQQIMFFIFKKDGRDEKEVEKLTIYMVVAVVVGARLGHCLFYDPGYYLTNLHKILYIWEGGLASHGGAIGILVALYLFAKKMKGMTYFWMLDRIVIVVCLTGALIRTGNFTNSEMIGTKTSSFLGVVFAQKIKEGLKYSYSQIEDIEFIPKEDVTSPPEGMVPMTAVITFKPNTGDGNLNVNNIKRSIELGSFYTDYVSLIDGNLPYRTYNSGVVAYGELDFYGIARHPAQLYEAFYCFILFLLLFHLWYWHRTKLPEGFIFGLFLVTLWSLRFIDEYFKLNQEPWEEGLPLNMGQMLSIPLVIAGIVILIRVTRRNKT